MWTRNFFGIELYYIIQWFLIYSMLGWLVESVYMSICKRTFLSDLRLWRIDCIFFVKTCL